MVGKQIQFKTYKVFRDRNLEITFFHDTYLIYNWLSGFKIFEGALIVQMNL